MKRFEAHFGAADEKVNADRINNAGASIEMKTVSPDPG